MSYKQFFHSYKKISFFKIGINFQKHLVRVCKKTVDSNIQHTFIFLLKGRFSLEIYSLFPLNLVFFFNL